MGVEKPGFLHIVFFRRQVYFESDDVVKLPDKFMMNYDGTMYHIYVTTDRMT